MKKYFTYKKVADETKPNTFWTPWVDLKDTGAVFGEVVPGLMWIEGTIPDSIKTKYSTVNKTLNGALTLAKSKSPARNGSIEGEYIQDFKIVGDELVQDII